MKCLQIIILCLIISSCKLQKISHTPHCGKVIIEWALDSSNYVFPISKSPCSQHYFLYKDSLIIDVVQRLVQSTIYKVSTTQKCDTSLFQFDNLQTNEFYQFANFSDTAIAIEKFKYPNKNFLGFVFNKEITINKEQAANLRDTIIDGESYKMYSDLYKISNGLDTIFEKGFYRKDNINNPVSFGFLPSFEKSNWTLFQRDMYYIKAKEFIRTRISVLRTYLTPEEEKVFDAWEKFAKEHPVKE